MHSSPMRLCGACIVLPLFLSGCDGQFIKPPAGLALVLRHGSANETSVGEPPKDENGRYICDTAPQPARTALRRISRRQYAASIALIFDNQITASRLFPDSFGKPTTGYSTEELINRLGEGGVENIMLAAEETAEQIADKLSQLSTCQADRGCATALIEKYAQRAFRGALDDDARDQLLRAYDGMLTDGGSFADGVAAIFAQALQMPQFLYQVEAAAPTLRALNGIELANRLAFLLWDSGPDDELLAASAALEQPAELQAQAQRMLASPRATLALTRFFREWTDTLELELGGKDATVFPQFDAALAASMNESFSRFVTHQVMNGESLHSLLTSTTVEVDVKTAPLFGVAAPSGWQSVTLDPQRYSGLFTQPAWLATQAHLAETSYVFRGRTIRKRVMCEVLGSPPGDAQAVFAAAVKPPDPTGKDLSAVVRSNPTCATCHTRVDPIGLAFEGFDALGAYRDHYKSGKPIDTTGTVQTFGIATLSFSNHVDLLHQLADSPEVRKCFATQLFRFALSRQEQPQDACTIQALDDTLIATQGNLKQALLAITQTDAFRLRSDE